MQLARVIGTVVSTRKDDGLVGYKLLVVELNPIHKNRAAERLVAVDYLGAGIGEDVLITTGSGSRMTLREGVPTDATIVGIIDTVATEE
jgi:ethanolamine utilization protein EutN